MSHPTMFDDADPLLARVRGLCAQLPGSTEKEAWGRPTFRCPRIYAVYGSHHGRDTALIVKPDPEERLAPFDDERFFVPAYYGPAGWVALDLDTSTDWAEVAELLAGSYRGFAPAARDRELDERGLPEVTA